MASRARARKLRAWSLWDERRKPSEYEIVTHKFHYHFRREPAPFELDPNAPINRWYRTYREGSPFQVDDWERFRDPDRLTYRAYTERQREREIYLDNLIDEFEQNNHYAQLAPEWVRLLETLYVPSRFSGHVLQMVALYVAQMAPSSYITNAFYFQGANELRRVQRTAYLTKALSLDHYPELADSERTRRTWEEDEHWQPMRELLEKLLVAYDWGEAFTALNLVVKPTYDALFNDQLARLARQNGDELLALMVDDFNLDSQWSRRLTRALVEYAVERRPENRELLQEWVEKWTPLARRAVAGLAPFFAQAPRPAAADAVVQAVEEQVRSFQGECGITV